MAKEIKIKIRDLHKSFGKKHVLNGVDLDLYKGESLVVIGGSGTGKSVLIKCIQGLLIPDSGSIEIDDIEIANENPDVIDSMHSKMGMLFQYGALFVGLTEDIADLYPSELSGGMQKRVGLARAVITRPEIIFFDEPTTGLDPIMADVINDLIIESAKDLGATTLTITHDMASARKIADKIAMLYEGKIIWYGTVKELDKTTNPYVRQFINGSSKGPIKVEK